MSDKFELSRRKMLAGLGTIGVAGAGAGLGTTALYTDVENINDSTITAGKLNMKVTGEIVAANQEYIDAVADITGNPIEADGQAEMGFTVQDFKPGDWFIVCITVDSEFNPFYLTMFAEGVSQSGGDNPEPEPGSDDGELGEELFTTVWGSFSSGSGRSGLSGLDSTADASVSGGGGSPGGWAEPNYPSGDATLQNGDSVQYTTFNELVNGYGANFNGWGSPDGILAREQNGDAAEIGSSDTSGILTDPDNDGDGELVFYVLFELPTESGNITMGDELSVDLRFSAEQVRNNGDPRSGRRTTTT